MVGNNTGKQIRYNPGGRHAYISYLCSQLLNQFLLFLLLLMFSITCKYFLRLVMTLPGCFVVHTVMQGQLLTK